jgi:hypothetical protein
MVARVIIFICIALTLVMGGSSHTKSETGIYSALYVYSGCKAAANLAVSPDGTVPLQDPSVAFCWGAFTVLRGVTSIVSNDRKTMALHVCEPTQSTVSNTFASF